MSLLGFVRQAFLLGLGEVNDVNSLYFLSVGIELTLQELIRFDSFIKLPLTHVALAHGPSVDAIAQQVIARHIKPRITQLVLQKRPVAEEFDILHLSFLFLFLG